MNEKTLEVTFISFFLRLYRDLVQPLCIFAFCVDNKAKLAKDHIAKVGNYYDGLLRRDSEYHFTFVETAPSSKGKRSPLVLNGDYITITRSKEGLLRINLKEVFITDDFSAKKFSRKLSKEIVSAVDGLLEKK